MLADAFISTLGHLWQNTGFGDKSIVFLHLLWKFRAGQLDLLSINFDFPNNIF